MTPAPAMRHLSAVLVVGRIEPCLPFWEERLGFARAAEGWLGDALGYVTLHRGGVTIMYQTRASLLAVLPPIADLHLGVSVLYLNVGDIEAVAAALEGADLRVPLHLTSYGSRELWVCEPGGHLIAFAEEPG
ncbi:MAG: hypothetical protein H6744_01385 [Deltaproteobacteria bacterium]|nr:hypothetical protein [Deltaproteobacteria bacterium]